MDYHTVADGQILMEIGDRIRKKRISMNLSQMALSKNAGISRRTVQAVEAGGSISMNKFIAILRCLNSLDAIDSFIPPVEISPLQLAKLKGRERQRAYKKNEVREDEGDYFW